MNHPVKPDDKILALRHALARARRECLALPPEKALARILDHPQPAALVHAFPEEDLHLLIREIGPDDALPLIGLASHKQLEYILDQEIWQRDRVDSTATTQWLERLLRSESSPQRMVHWLAEEKTDLIELFLFRSIEVRMREHDQDPSVLGPDFFSYDNVFYIRILAPPTSDDQEPPTPGASPQDTVKRLLDQLAENDHIRFQAILLEAAHVLPAEFEEEQYRLRTARLAEKGFLPFEEAVGLYQPFNEDRLLHQALRHKPLAAENPDLYALVPMAVLTDQNLFARALGTMGADTSHQALQEEFAALCNRIIVADHREIDNRHDLAAIVAKASGYLNIGLQKRQPKGQAPSTPDIHAAGQELQRYHLEGLFRLGYGEVVQLKTAAERWVSQSWFAGQGVSLTFWGETWLGVLGGLLIKRPLFFDNYRSGSMYREFADMADLEWTRRQLEQVQQVDSLLGAAKLQLAGNQRPGFLTYKNLLLTLWARHRLAMPEEVRPLTTEAFRPFYRELFSPWGATSSEPTGRIDASLRRDFLDWLAERTHVPADEIAAVIGSSIESLFGELEEHYGKIAAEKIDPRFMPHFLLEPSEGRRDAH